MDHKKIKADSTTNTRNLTDFDKETNNIYETVVMLGKRANQISSQIKEELDRKLGEFTTTTENLEEIFENREQIEVSRFYERLPKPVLIAIREFLDGNVYYRVPEEQADNGKAAE